MNPISRHSPEDWDFQTSGLWALSSDRFISTPTSLCRPTDTTNLHIAHVSLKPTFPTNIKQGRLVTYFNWKHLTLCRTHLLARAQTQPYLGEPANCYKLLVINDRMQLHCRLNGSATVLGEGFFSPQLAINTWYRVRFTWFEVPVEGQPPILRLQGDMFEYGLWQNYITYDDINNRWSGSAVNYIGFALEGVSVNAQCFIDDTEVYQVPGP